MHPNGKPGSRFYFCFLCNVSKVWPLLPGHAARPLSRAASRPANLFLLKASVCLQGCAENGVSWARGSDRAGPCFWCDLPQCEEGEESASLSSLPWRCQCFNFSFRFHFSPLFSVFSLWQLPVVAMLPCGRSWFSSHRVASFSCAFCESRCKCCRVRIFGEEDESRRMRSSRELVSQPKPESPVRWVLHRSAKGPGSLCRSYWTATRSCAKAAFFLCRLRLLYDCLVKHA